MPLEHSASPAAFKRNVSTLMGEIGHSPHVASREQALAIAYATKRRAGRAMGGPINPAMMQPPMPGTAPGMAMPGNVMPMGVAGPASMPFMRPRASGGFNIAKGPNLNPPNYFERAEARDMTHGPIMSAMPGRSDTHYTKVPSGSYVLPAAHIASMGQGNSMAGLKLAQSQFGPNGPYGIGAMKMPRGPGAPKPPRFGGFNGSLGLALGGSLALENTYSYSEGGARGHGHQPVDVALSGGEYVILPEVVRNIGHGSLKNGHKILDAYVMHARKKEIETQKKLPPPAKK